jgi:acetyl-CoA carboxylase biotin carboxyl carrier protein
MDEQQKMDIVDVQQVRELAELMSEHGLNEIKICAGEMRLQLRRGIEATGVQAVQAPPVALPAAAAPAVAPSAPEVTAPAEDDGLVPITSPMVGTFYAASDPESPVFVQIGADVGPDTTVCIIEAMKVFNEIKAEVAGTVEQILVRNEQAVEYGQPLMLVRPRS